MKKTSKTPNHGANDQECIISKYSQVKLLAPIQYEPAVACLAASQLSLRQDAFRPLSGHQNFLMPSAVVGTDM